MSDIISNSPDLILSIFTDSFPCNCSNDAFASLSFLALIIYFIYVIIKCIRLSVAVQAYQAIILLVLFFSGVQILLFGIIGEYLGRIFNASKNRPLYLVNEYNGKREENE